MKAPSTEILLATYNGAPFIEDLLRSLDSQTDQEWTLLVRDDGSTDTTVPILTRWGEGHPGKLRWLDDGGRNLGPMGNFVALLAASEADYFLLCDQDDVWLPEKVARLKRKIGLAETESGRDTPTLVHTDLIVADTALRPIAQSFWRYQRMVLPSTDAPWKILALQNVVTGCATIGNAALRRAALPVPAEAMMHDWWLALVAACMGRITRDPEPSVLYRQHGRNSLGAVSWAAGRGLVWVLSAPIRAARIGSQAIDARREQARVLTKMYTKQLDPIAREYLEEYSCLGTRPFISRKTFHFKHGVWFGDFIRNVGLVALV